VRTLLDGDLGRERARLSPRRQGWYLDCQVPRREGRRHLEALGGADDARDADGLSVFAFSQAQERARAWFQGKVREQAGYFVPLDRYTVADALADYRADYQRRSGKAIDRLGASAGAWIGPQLGAMPLDKLTKGRILSWHHKIAETPPRLRTKPSAAQGLRGTGKRMPAPKLSAGAARLRIGC
jgi:hypothetical protein